MTTNTTTTMDATSSFETDLESRVKVRRAELLGELGELRKSVRHQAKEVSDKLRAGLSELAHIIKEGVVDGWANLGDTTKHKLERWLTESARFPAKAVAAKTEQS